MVKITRSHCNLWLPNHMSLAVVIWNLLRPSKEETAVHGILAGRLDGYAVDRGNYTPKHRIQILGRAETGVFDIHVVSIRRVAILGGKLKLNWSFAATIC